jgi:hypothetical protein
VEGVAVVFGLSYLKLGLIAAAVVLIGYLMWREHSLTRKVAEKHAALIIEREKVEKRDQQIKQLHAEAEKQRKASDDYQTELERLQAARADTPVRVVRLCRTAPSVPEAASGPPEAGTEGLPVEAGPDSRERLEAGIDIGDLLYQLADEADQCAAQRDALIRWFN